MRCNAGTMWRSCLIGNRYCSDSRFHAALCLSDFDEKMLQAVDDHTLLRYNVSSVLVWFYGRCSSFVIR